MTSRLAMPFLAVAGGYLVAATVAEWLSEEKDKERKEKELQQRIAARKEHQLRIAARHGRLYIVRHLLEQGVNVNAKHRYYPGESWSGKAPLHLACQGGHRQVIAELVAYGADVNARSSSGKTPLHVAIQREQFCVVEDLITYGADVNAREWEENSRFTPLHRASQGRSAHYASVARTLVLRGASVEAKASQQLTPLHVACRDGGCPQVVQELIRLGANVNARTGLGWTPSALFYASRGGRTDIVRLLLVEGADVLLQNNKGFTILDLAKQRGHTCVAEAIVRMLLDQDTCKNGDGLTALDLAKLRRRHSSTVETVQEYLSDRFELVQRAAENEDYLDNLQLLLEST